MWFTPLLQGAAQQQSGGTGLFLRNVSNRYYTSGTLPCEKPTNTQATDVLVAVLTSSWNVATVTAPSGWTNIPGATFNSATGHIRAFWALGSVIDPTFFASETGGATTVAIFAFAGADNTSPIRSAATNSTTGTSIEAPSVNANAGDSLIHVWYNWQGEVSNVVSPGVGVVDRLSISYVTRRIYSTVENLAITGATAAQTRSAPNFEGKRAVTIAIAAAPTGQTIYRPTSDITTTGWTASSGAVLYDMIDESVASDADYISSPALGASTGPATFGIGSVPAGSYTVSLRARETAPDGEVRVVMRDAGGTAVGTSAWQALGLSFTTYSLSVSTSGTAAQLSVEVQSVGGNDPQIAPSLTASRITGTAPLAVHFDATATTSTRTTDDWREITYGFNYGDAGSGTWATNGQSKNSDSGGPLGAHVYETPGTYTVTLTANDGTGSSTTTASITVADPDTVYAGTNTICIDPTGGTTDGPAGCQYVTSMPTIISNRRYLIKRGSTIAGFTVPRTVSGVRIGAYGTGAKPSLTSTLVFNQGNQPSTAQWVEDVCVSDLSLQNGTTLIQSGRHVTLLRCEVVNTTTPLDSYFYLGGETKFWATRTDQPPLISPSDFFTPECVAIVDCLQRGQFASRSGALTGMYGGYDKLIFMGNDFRGSPEHNVRVYLARLSLLQHNRLEDKTFDTGRHCIKLHAGGIQETWGQMGTTFSPKSYQNIIRRNILGAADSICDWSVAVRPENRLAQGGDQGLEDTIVEDNSFINSATKTLDIVAGPAKKTTTRGNTRDDGAIRINQDTGTYPEPIQSSWRGPYYGQYTG